MNIKRKKKDHLIFERSKADRSTIHNPKRCKESHNLWQQANKNGSIQGSKVVGITKRWRSRWEMDRIQDLKRGIYNEQRAGKALSIALSFFAFSSKFTLWLNYPSIYIFIEKEGERKRENEERWKMVREGESVVCGEIYLHIRNEGEFLAILSCEKCRSRDNGRWYLTIFNFFFFF